MSTQADSPNDVQATASPVPPPKPASSPAAATSRPRLARWLVFVFAFVGALVSVAGEARPVGILFVVGYLVGGFIALVIVAYVLPGIFLVWTRRTRRLLDRAAALVAGAMVPLIFASFAMSPGEHRTHADDPALTNQKATVALMRTALGAEDGQPFPLPDVPPAPRAGASGREQAAWILRAVLTDLVAWSVETARREGVATPPAGWWELDHIASAASHPEYAAYLDRLADIERRLRKELPAAIEAIVAQRGQEAGLSPPEIAALANRVQRAFEESFSYQHRLRITMQHAHWALVEMDPRVTLSDGRLVFEQAADRARAERLLDQVAAAATALVERAEEHVDQAEEDLAGY